jgi:hypothetical protein
MSDMKRHKWTYGENGSAEAFRRGNSAPATPPLHFPDGTLNINVNNNLKYQQKLYKFVPSKGKESLLK